MDETRVRFMRCPYCGKEGSHGNTVSNSVGMFRIKMLYTNVLILQCQSCKKICRGQLVGSILTWADMSAEEKKTFKKKHFKAYTKLKLNETGGKNGK